MLKIKIDGVVSAENIPEIIPAGVEELELECPEVAERAFFNNKTLRRLRLVNVAKIGEFAFNGTWLEAVELVNCWEIERFAFANDKKLSELKVTGAEMIGEKAFSTCSSLKTVDFESCEMTGSYAFKQCRGLEAVRLDCREISEWSFHECQGIGSVTLENVETICRYAFSHTYIREFNLPEPIPELQSHALELATVHNWRFAPSGDKWLKIKVDGVLSSEEIPFNVKYLEIECREIPNRAFYKHKFLQRIRLKNVKMIGKFAFSHCNKLLSAEAENCGEIGEYAFEDSGLLELTLDNVRKIGERAFYCCKRLAGVELSGGGEIGAEAFAECGNFVRANLDCREIGDNAFYKCAVNDLKLTNTEVVGESAFEECRNLREIELPETLREIKSRAFFGTCISRCVIPRGVLRLGKAMFGSLDTLEVYQSADGKFPRFVDGEPWRATIIARSAQTDEILFEYISTSDCEVLTEHGADFTEYDKNLPGFWERYGNTARIEAAIMRLSFPYGLNAETRGELLEYCSKTAAYELKDSIMWPFQISCLTNFKYYDYVKLPAFLEVVTYSIEENLGEYANVLLKVLYKKLCESNEELSRERLMTVLDYSSKNGFTDLSAVILQRLNELRGENSDFDL